jgi:hypothetical protein
MKDNLCEKVRRGCHSHFRGIEMDVEIRSPWEIFPHLNLRQEILEVIYLVNEVLRILNFDHWGEMQ